MMLKRRSKFSVAPSILSSVGAAAKETCPSSKEQNRTSQTFNNGSTKISNKSIECEVVLPSSNCNKYIQIKDSFVGHASNANDSGSNVKHVSFSTAPPSSVNISESNEHLSSLNKTGSATTTASSTAEQTASLSKHNNNHGTNDNSSLGSDGKPCEKASSNESPSLTFRRPKAKVVPKALLACKKSIVEDRFSCVDFDQSPSNLHVNSPVASSDKENELQTACEKNNRDSSPQSGNNQFSSISSLNDTTLQTTSNSVKLTDQNAAVSFSTSNGLDNQSQSSTKSTTSFRRNKFKLAPKIDRNDSSQSNKNVDATQSLKIHPKLSSNVVGRTNCEENLTPKLKLSSSSVDMQGVSLEKSGKVTEQSTTAVSSPNVTQEHELSPPEGCQSKLNLSFRRNKFKMAPKINPNSIKSPEIQKASEGKSSEKSHLMNESKQNWGPKLHLSVKLEKIDLTSQMTEPPMPMAEELGGTKLASEAQQGSHANEGLEGSSHATNEQSLTEENSVHIPSNIFQRRPRNRLLPVGINLNKFSPKRNQLNTSTVTHNRSPLSSQIRETNGEVDECSNERSIDHRQCDKCDTTKELSSSQSTAKPHLEHHQKVSVDAGESSRSNKRDMAADEEDSKDGNNSDTSSLVGDKEKKKRIPRPSIDFAELKSRRSTLTLQDLIHCTVTNAKGMDPSCKIECPDLDEMMKAQVNHRRHTKHIDTNAVNFLTFDSIKKEFVELGTSHQVKMEMGTTDGVMNGEKSTKLEAVDSSTTEFNNNICKNEVENNEESINIFAPRLKMGEDGKFVLDEESLVIEQTSELSLNNGVVTQAGSLPLGTYQRSLYHFGYRNSKGIAIQWTEAEVKRLYMAIQMVGVDFSMVMTLIPDRSHKELQTKFNSMDRDEAATADKLLSRPLKYDRLLLKSRYQAELASLSFLMYEKRRLKLQFEAKRRNDKNLFAEWFLERDFEEEAKEKLKSKIALKKGCRKSKNASSDKNVVPNNDSQQTESNSLDNAVASTSSVGSGPVKKAPRRKRKKTDNESAESEKTVKPKREKKQLSETAKPIIESQPTDSNQQPEQQKQHLLLPKSIKRHKRASKLNDLERSFGGGEEEAGVVQCGNMNEVEIGRPCLKSEQTEEDINRAIEAAITRYQNWKNVPSLSKTSSNNQATSSNDTSITALVSFNAADASQMAPITSTDEFSQQLSVDVQFPRVLVQRDGDLERMSMCSSNSNFMMNSPVDSLISQPGSDHLNVTNNHHSMIDSVDSCQTEKEFNDNNCAHQAPESVNNDQSVFDQSRPHPPTGFHSEHIPQINILPPKETLLNNIIDVVLAAQTGTVTAEGGKESSTMHSQHILPNSNFSMMNGTGNDPTEIPTVCESFDDLRDSSAFYSQCEHFDDLQNSPKSSKNLAYNQKEIEVIKTSLIEEASSLPTSPIPFQEPLGFNSFSQEIVNSENHLAEDVNGEGAEAVTLTDISKSNFPPNLHTKDSYDALGFDCCLRTLDIEDMLPMEIEQVTDKIILDDINRVIDDNLHRDVTLCDENATNESSCELHTPTQNKSQTNGLTNNPVVLSKNASKYIVSVDETIDKIESATNSNTILQSEKNCQQSLPHTETVCSNDKSMSNDILQKLDDKPRPSEASENWNQLQSRLTTLKPSTDVETIKNVPRNDQVPTHSRLENEKLDLNSGTQTQSITQSTESTEELESILSSDEQGSSTVVTNSASAESNFVSNQINKSAPINTLEEAVEIVDVTCNDLLPVNTSTAVKNVNSDKNSTTEKIVSSSSLEKLGFDVVQEAAFDYEMLGFDDEPKNNDGCDTLGFSSFFDDTLEESNKQLNSKKATDTFGLDQDCTSSKVQTTNEDVSEKTGLLDGVISLTQSSEKTCNKELAPVNFKTTSEGTNSNVDIDLTQTTNLRIRPAENAIAQVTSEGAADENFTPTSNAVEETSQNSQLTSSDASYDSKVNSFANAEDEESDFMMENVPSPPPIPENGEIGLIVMPEKLPFAFYFDGVNMIPGLVSWPPNDDVTCDQNNEFEAQSSAATEEGLQVQHDVQDAGYLSSADSTSGYCSQSLQSCSMGDYSQMILNSDSGVVEDVEIIEDVQIEDEGNAKMNNHSTSDSLSELSLSQEADDSSPFVPKIVRRNHGDQEWDQVIEMEEYSSEIVENNYTVGH